MNKSFFLTQEGYEKLKTELGELTSVERKAIAQKIKEAREFGDLSENAEYTNAKDQQAFIEGRIAELNQILKNSILIDEQSKSHDIIMIGSIVHLKVTNGIQKFVIVGSQEADPSQGKISNESPIGRALLGRKKGEEVEIDVPAGTIRYKVLKIE